MLIFVLVVSYLSGHCLSSLVADETSRPAPVADGENLVDFDRLGRLLETLDYHLQDFQKRTCRLGLHSHNCAFIGLERSKDVGDFLRSGESPGKRAPSPRFGSPDYEMTSSELRAADAVLEDLMEQRRAVNTLRVLLHAMKKDLENIRTTKRDCRFRLGGHCLTESLDRAANQFYYLRSPDSPGRRRRHANN